MNTKAAYGMDHFGMAASTACAIHCIFMALIPSGLALGGFQAFFSHEAEWGISILTGILGLVAVAFGYRVHRSNLVLGMMVGSVAGLMLSRFMEEWGIHGLGTVVGVCCGIGLAVGHFLNLRATRCCKACI